MDDISDDASASIDRRLWAYEVLGLSPRATKEEIVAAYRAKAREHHTDLGGSAERFKDVQAAKHILDVDGARLPTMHQLLQSRQVLRSLAPRMPGFLYGAKDQVDGRSRLVCVQSYQVADGLIHCIGIDGKRYGAHFKGSMPTRGRAIKAIGVGEPGIRGGEPGDLYLWIP